MQPLRRLSSTAAIASALLGVIAGCRVRQPVAWVEAGTRKGTIEYQAIPGDGVKWLYFDEARLLMRVEERVSEDPNAALQSAIAYEYEENRVVRREFRGPSGDLATRDGDVAITRYAYGPNSIECTFFDQRDTTATRWGPVHKISYARTGRVGRAEYVGSDGTLVNNGRSFATMLIQYDDRARPTMARFFDRDGKAVEAQFRGVPAAVVRYEFLSGVRGPIVAEHCLNAAGKTTGSQFYDSSPEVDALCECGIDSAGRPAAESLCHPKPATTSVQTTRTGY